MIALMMFGFILYFFIISCIVLWVYKQATTATTTADAGFMLGNRSVNYWLTALSAHASDMSDWLFMAYPAVIYAEGLIQGWISISLVIGMFLSWHFIAPKLRTETERYDSFTLSTFFERRFTDTTGMIRVITAIMCLLFLTIYIAAGLKGIGFLLESAFGFHYATGIFIAIGFITAYTLIGGFVAVAWIDAFQALFLLGVLVIVPLVVFITTGSSVQAIEHAAIQKGVTLSLLPHSVKDIIQIIFITLTWGLGYFSMPHILTKFMGIKDVREMHKSKYLGITWQIIVLAAATAVGLIGMAYFTHGLVNKELVFVEMVLAIFPPLLAGFMLCAILAAGLSTIDSQVLVLASVLTEDLYNNPLFRTKNNTRNLLWFYRISILVIASISCGIALYTVNSTIQELVKYAWMGLSCSFGPIVISALYGTKINKWGALSGILLGGGISALWEIVLHNIVTIYSLAIPAVIPGFLTGFVAIYLVSWLTHKG